MANGSHGNGPRIHVYLEFARRETEPRRLVPHGLSDVLGLLLTPCLGPWKVSRNGRFPPTWMHTLWREGRVLSGRGFGLENFRQDTWRPRELSGEGALQAGSRRTSTEAQ